MKGYMYILECSDGSYYTGSTTDLERRLAQHQNGEGANHTKKHSPVELVYYEEYERIDQAFYREKQVQGWSRKKKEALINGCFDKLSSLSKNYTQYPRNESVISTGSITEENETVISTGSITEENNSVSEPDNSVSEPVNSVSEPVNSVSEPVNSVSEPVNSVSEPVNSVSEPVNSVSEPVEDTAKTQQP